MRIGIDLSKDNFVSSWDLVKGAGVEFAFIKASEGVTIQDSMYGKHCLGASRVKIPTYPYHFFRPLDTGIAQATNFLMASSRSYKRMALDLENCPTITGNEWLQITEEERYKEIKDFLNLMPSSISIEIYLTESFYNSVLPNASFLSEYGLWIARYNQQTGPLPTPWKTYDFWQHDEHGIVTGISGDVDLSFADDGVVL